MKPPSSESKWVCKVQGGLSQPGIGHFAERQSRVTQYELYGTCVYITDAVLHTSVESRHALDKQSPARLYFTTLLTPVTWRLALKAACAVAASHAATQGHLAAPKCKQRQL